MKLATSLIKSLVKSSQNQGSFRQIPYFRFPLSLRMIEEMLAACGIDVGHERLRHWAGNSPVAFALRSGSRRQMAS
jgi:hypothetical protein